MKPILVPVNFSPCAANATRYAADLALSIGAEVHLLNIIPVPMTSTEMSLTEYVYEEMVNAANKSLKEMAADLLNYSDNQVKVHLHLLTGGIVSGVKQVCKELQPYAVIAGIAGASLEKLIGGSPVSSFLHQIDYPVLVVPETARFKKFRRIALACDLNDIVSGIPQALPLLKELKNTFSTSFDIITIETDSIVWDESVVFKSDAWKAELKDLYPNVHFLCSPSIEEGLSKYLDKEEADLLIVFPKKHGFFEFHKSQSRKIAKHSFIPVMSLHEA